MQRPTVAALLVVIGFSAGCGKPDTKALQTLACQHVASSIDLQSVSQLDLLRKALGVAPDVDPIGTCRALGVSMGQQSSPRTEATKPE